MEDDELLARIFHLQQQLRKTELENDQLSSQLSEKQKWLDQLQDTIMVASHKPRKHDPVKKELLNYYNSRKNDEELLARIKKDLDVIGYEINIPWQMVKYHTDKEWMAKNDIKLP